MSLDIALVDNGEYVWEGNITHNLGRMARAAGAYEATWTPDEPPDGDAPYEPRDAIDEVVPAINHLLYERHHYEQFNPENGWGDYDTLVRFLVDYALALNQYPNAKIEVSR